MEEVERKFLFPADALAQINTDEPHGERVVQFYLSSDGNATVTAVLNGEKGSLTVRDAGYEYTYDRPAETIRVMLATLCENVSKIDGVTQGALRPEILSATRVRTKGGQTLFTIKGPKVEGAGFEDEFVIPDEHRQTIISTSCQNGVDKTRYKVPMNVDGAKLTLKIDVFKKPSGGLVMGEVEFPDRKAAAAFEPGSFNGLGLDAASVKEVTDDKRYQNTCLANLVDATELASAPFRPAGAGEQTLAFGECRQ